MKGFISKDLHPFWVLLLITLLIITYVPAVSMWLPGTMGL